MKTETVEKVVQVSALDLEQQRKEKAQRVAANEAEVTASSVINLIVIRFRRYKELQEANEKKKAEIKRRDELRQLKQQRMLEESAV